jgi:hypothetical protein
MREEGQRPRGGIRNAAMEEIAERQGKTAPTLDKQLKRFRKRQRKRGLLHRKAHGARE